MQTVNIDQVNEVTTVESGTLENSTLINPPQIELNETTFQHGFKIITIDLDSEKNLKLEALLKKYRDNLFISVPLNTLNITESTTNRTVTNLQETVKAGSFYVVNLKHDAKG